MTSTGPQTIQKAKGESVTLGCTYTPGSSDTGDLDIEWSNVSPDMTQKDTLVRQQIRRGNRGCYENSWEEADDWFVSLDRGYATGHRCASGKTCFGENMLRRRLLFYFVTERDVCVPDLILRRREDAALRGCQPVRQTEFRCRSHERRRLSFDLLVTSLRHSDIPVQSKEGTGRRHEKSHRGSNG